ncbi:Non-specific lipid-transfer protein [Quillaja saponaria]|uniref:Non-specific lipid-transfer protein n=1 Tax=Quillaja saponaria TaxID=32244 RepID=A0AAD7VN19_QUISA|nr:Non-specific lipid-transfer protein [Quillaja saponaria]
MTALMLILLLLASSSPSDAVISCADVAKYLRPCIDYLTKGSGSPPAACCGGARALVSATSSPADRRTACQRVKTSAQRIRPNPQLAQALPRNCGIKLPFNVSPDVDCTRLG